MTSADNLPESSLLFFKSLFLKTGGEIQKQVSMHDIGNACGLDKAASRMIAEELMSLGLIDIRTLSGGIGMTDELALSHRVRRLLAIDRRRGDQFHHLGTLAESVQQGVGLYA